MSEIKKAEVSSLCYLLACALNGNEPQSLEGVDYKALLDLAKKHQVYNIIFPVLSTLDGVPEEELQRFRDYSMSELKRMLVVNNERAQIYAQLSEGKIRFMPLKGLILKNYYPKESMRQMSDNDLLYDEENRDAVAKLMSAQGYKTIATGENSDDYFKEPFSAFEFHRTLFFEEKDFSPRFDNLWENATPDVENPYLYHMGLSDVYLYSVCHMFKHYSTAGCGIRFLADNYLFLKKESENLDFDYINSKLSEYGILDFEVKTRELAFELFNGGELTSEQEELLQVFVNFGIFGSGKVQLEKEIEKLSRDGSVKEAKRKYVLHRLFPPKKKMLADYRALEKRPYLLPAYYVYRLFKGAAHTEDTINEVKNVNSIKE